MTEQPIQPGDTVVLVDASGQFLRDRGQILRGIVLSIAFIFGDRIATVSLVRSGNRVHVGLGGLRRCPQLASVRPRQAQLSPRGAT